MAYYALYRQWGNGLLKEDESKTKITPDVLLQNFVILKSQKHLFDHTLPRNKEYLAYNGISIVENAIDDSLWR